MDFSDLRDRSAFNFKNEHKIQKFNTNTLRIINKISFKKGVLGHRKGSTFFEAPNPVYLLRRMYPINMYYTIILLNQVRVWCTCYDDCVHRGAPVRGLASRNDLRMHIINYKNGSHTLKAFSIECVLSTQKLFS